MKKIVLTALAILLPMVLCAESEEVKDGIDALLETIDLAEWDDWFSQNGPEGGTPPSKYLRELAAVNPAPNEGKTIEALAANLISSLKSAVLRAAFYIGLAVLCAALDGMADRTSIGETAKTALRVSVSGAVLGATFYEIRSAVQMLTVIDRTTEILLPVLVGFLTLCGMNNTAVLLPVSYSLLSETVLKLLRVAAVPLSVLGGVLIVLDAGGTGRLSSAGKLMHRAARWILGTVCAIFLIVTTARSVAAGSADGVLIKTTKLAASSIPSVGALLSESVEAGLQCLRFVRNMLGLTGCVLILSVAARPILSNAAARCALRASAMLSEPLSGRPYAEMLRGVGDTLHNLMLAELAMTATALLVIAPVFGVQGAM